MIHAENVSKRVQVADSELCILKGTSLEIKRGESVAIIGPSGSGKSTLLGLLAGLDEPTDGDIWLAGEHLNALDEDGRAALRSKLVGFVFQSFQLLPGLTALENVMLPLELRGDRRAVNVARDYLERVGLAHRLGHYPRQLSGGEQQRVGIARAVVHKPKILLADEPTGNLDPQLSAEIMALFKRFQDVGVTVLVATHDIDLINRMNLRIMRLNQGELELDGVAHGIE